jgi:dTDP-4-dehydrorhamnose reductase
MKKIAILGANGTIGTLLCDLLKDAGNLLPVTRKNLDLLSYNAVTDWLERERPDVVINCAFSGGSVNTTDINLSDLQRNMQMFFNFYHQPSKFRYINFGSGAEFDRARDINNVTELEITERNPIDTYGQAKNYISRAIWNRENFYTLRLFGCFGYNEPDSRLFKRLLNTGKLNIVDRRFDYFSHRDMTTVIKHYVSADDQDLIKDVNLVYQQKYSLYYQALLFAEQHCPESVITLSGNSPNNYTASGDTLANLNLNLTGLKQGIEDYKPNVK